MYLCRILRFTLRSVLPPKKNFLGALHDAVEKIRYRADLQNFCYEWMTPDRFAQERSGLDFGRAA